MSQVVSPPDPDVALLRPLCVDLDGTLVKSDTLIDSLLAFARSHPARLLASLPRLFRGKAAFKAFIAAQAPLDVVHLPYNRKLLQFLHDERTRGRAIYLVTGADSRLAERVASHLGIFTGVFSSDGATNLIGARKLDRLRRALGSHAYDYVGNDTPDLPLLAHAAQSMIANPSLRLRLRLRTRRISNTRIFAERANFFLSLLRALRPHQWAKNLLVFLPLLLAHVTAPNRLLTALLAFACFSLTASSAYIVNDLFDIEADRRHRQKRLRPFAAGDLSAFSALVIVALLLLLVLSAVRLLPLAFYGWLIVYFATALAYSGFLKRIALVDVLILSGLYTLRLVAGSAATHSHISDWLAGFSVFLFFSLAIVKRFAELENVRTTGTRLMNGRGYLLTDIDQLRSFGTASAFAAVMVFAIYISGSDVTLLYRRPHLLWLIMPLLILWLCRVWLLASRGQLHEDPLIFALTDRMSLALGAVVAAIVLLAI